MNWLNTNFPNWRTGLSSMFSALCMGGFVYVASGNHFTWLGFGAAVGIAALGYFSKDKAVTGGSVPQTPEAVTRAEEITKIPL